MHHGLRYVGDGELMLYGFVDSYWIGDAGGKKSTLRFSFNLGSSMISSFNRKQPAVALSSTKEEYTVASFARYEAI
jgi:hypothetical protein